MLDIIAASLLAKANSSTATKASPSTCISITCSATSITEQNLYRKINAIAMQHLHCKQQTLKKSQLLCQKRMRFGRWHHCDINILHAIDNICLNKRMPMHFNHNKTNQSSTKYLTVKSTLRLTNTNKNNYINGNNNLVTFRGRGVSMKLFLASSLFNNSMMCV